ncbi:DUF3302 domain-containing protein [Phragmitibacter flavus]|uniref:DUF3302 domain-containing protein n=1 Tax=Phragmitibacter flavus TaxID=2576071 RepID=A0A5R8KIK2_9BACT|nr:DUF3302 domain-containing protein [Phragmitibacter flavus]TLD72097.1 DUF3302 domain-containing protein [Phragmitibacter flavus]
MKPFNFIRRHFFVFSAGLLACPASAHASLFKGEALDKVAEGMSWLALIIAPIVLIGVFLILHIMPEKIAEKKKHPQTPAIQCLCLLSLFFGGLLWPLAWLWAYSKPVLHKLAYGTDVDESVGHHGNKKDAPLVANDETQKLRDQIATLEAQLAASNLKGRKA